MKVSDYNGEGKWSRKAIIERYQRYADESGVAPRDISPPEHKQEDCLWVYPVMDEVIEGIKANDPACVRIGIEFIEEDRSFAFGRILKSNTARALRRATLTEEQCERIRRRVFSMLRAGYVPREFRDYAKLVKKIGFHIDDMGHVPSTKEHVLRYRKYLEDAATPDVKADDRK